MKGTRGIEKNRNSQRSKQLLITAYAELLSEKDAKKISVTDVTSRADLNRSTFYTHFENVDDLLRCILHDVSEQVLEVADTASKDSFMGNPDPTLKKVAEYLQANLPVYRNLMQAPHAIAFLTDMKQQIADRVIETCAPTEHTTLDLRIPIEYITGGIVDIYASWLCNRYQDVSLNDINNAASKLIHASCQTWL